MSVSLKSKKRSRKGGSSVGDEVSIQDLGIEVLDLEGETGDDFSEPDDGQAPKGKDKNFEFTDSLSIMRLSRMIIFLQVMSLIIDNPSVQLPIIFRILNRGVLYYAGHFYSRIIIDFVYGFQLLIDVLNQSMKGLPAQPTGIEVETPTTPEAPNTGDVSNNSPQTGDLPGAGGGLLLHRWLTSLSGRMLSASSYEDVPPKAAQIGATADFHLERNWHSIKSFSHFFLSALFAIVVVLLTLCVWEIRDYSDRKEIREWLREYIADGWWRRGLLKTITGLAKCCFAMLAFAFGLFAVARELNVNSLPEASMVGCSLAMIASILLAHWIIGYMGLRSAEVSFVRYVSQNVSYTSSIILKRVVKSKVDIGLTLMFAMYMPALYIFIKSFFPIMDWNKTLAQTHRRPVNYYVPCYFMAFPPYTEIHRNPGLCPVAYATSPLQPQTPRGYYRDRSILSCDSYLGVSIFTTGVFFFVFLAVTYLWLWYSFVRTASHEFQNCRFVLPLKTLLSIKEELSHDYNKEFNIAERLMLELAYEASTQGRFIAMGVRFLIEQPIVIAKATAQMSMVPIAFVLSPFTTLINSIFATCCESLTVEGRRRKVRDAAREKKREMAKYKEITGEDFVFDEEEEEEEEEVIIRPATQIVSDAIIWFILNYNPINILYETLRLTNNQFWHQFNHSAAVADLKVQWVAFKTSVFGCWIEETASKGLIAMGGGKGSWRVSLSIASKRAMLENINHRIHEALCQARRDFVSDHALTITVFDRVVDSSGLFMLISQYHYNRLAFTMLLWFEMTIIVIVAAVSNYYVDWQTRTQYILGICCVFGVLTYFIRPFSEDCDRWFDFCGRIMVIITCGGILYCHANTPPGKYDNVPAKMYDAQASLPFLMSMSTLSSISGLVDVVISLYMYFYCIYIVHFIGVFHAISRKIRTLTFGMHDHILDFLMEKLDERTIGAENMYTGLMVVQQWDDIIREQRSYALIPWPDVRPPDVLSAFSKMVEIKWAALFNLNVTNLRSSLGLTLLHTAMCNADGEVARWLIHLYPELLNVQDFQNDTPIFIALKECAYLLLRFGQQNDGVLEDNTSYNDEEFLSYYPEIEQYREDAADNGEYLVDFADIYKLDAIEERFMHENGYIVETKNTDKALYKPTFRSFKSKLGKFATHDEIEAEKAAKAKFEEENNQFLTAKVETDPAKLAEIKRLKAKKDAQILAAEKLSLSRKRFPEDDFQDNFESGQMAAWGILGLDVPDMNLFIDPKTSKFRSAEHGDGEQGYFKREEQELHLDARYVVHSFSSTPVHADSILNAKTGVSASAYPVPDDHPSLDDMKDWDIVRKKKRMTARTLLTSIFDTKTVLQSVGAMAGTAVTLSQRQAKDREVRYKMCKFAEIFLSDEILESAKVMNWDSHAYKELNKMASKEQGRIAQNLAMACNMNPPSGFTRISEWTMGISTNVFDEHPDEERNIFMKGALLAGDTVKHVHGVVSRALPKRGARRAGQGPRNHGNLDYNRIGKLSHQSGPFSDRIIHYLAECLVSCRNRLHLSDCELSMFGRFGWRAIARALRRNNCTFIMPSIFVSTKEINVTHLDLSRNELDCGDAILLSDIILYKQSLIMLDLSYNRIGSRGLIRLCKAMKGHGNIAVMNLNHNRIGPAAGREIGILLKNNDSLRVMDFSHNRMGELVRFPTLLCRERIASAARDIFQGLRANTSVEVLDLAYNHLGPKLGECVPVAIMRHPTLTFLDLSGNSIGPVIGPAMIFALAGEPGGDAKIEAKERTEREILEMIKNGIDPIEEMNARKLREEAEEAKNGSPGKSKKSKKKKMGSPGSPGSFESFSIAESSQTDDTGLPIPCNLAMLHMADNQLGFMAGYAAGALVTNSKTLTSLNLSGNALGYRGCVGFADGLEKCYGLEPRNVEKLTLYKMDQQKYEGRDAIPKPLIYTNLINLNISRNGMGPTGCQGIMYCVNAPSCTLTSIDVSDNPIGYSIENGGDATLLGVDMRQVMASARSMTYLNISRTSLLPVEMVPILGGLSRNAALRELVIVDMPLDEPSCLQLAHGLTHCKTLRRFQLRNTKIGPKGGLIIMNRAQVWGRRISNLDLSGNNIGPIAIIPLSQVLADHHCAFKILHLAENDVLDEGGMYIIKGLKANGSVTDLDLSSNCMSDQSAENLADVARGLFRDGRKINDCLVKKIVISDNNFGQAGCKLLAKAFTAGNFEHLEMSNCGAGHSTAKIVASALRDVSTNWRVLDFRSNNLGRQGMNSIFWALRQNRSLRVLLLGENNAGPQFGSDDDALLGHGVAIQRAIRSNVMLREIDLSYNGIDTRGGINIMEAMLENYTVRKLCLRGNVLDDAIHYALSDLFRYNDVMDELDLGENRLGYQCCFSVADGLECNRALKILYVDYNTLNAAGHVTIDAFVRCLSMNTSLRVLVMDGNKLGSEWGVSLADALSRNNTLIKVSLRDSRFDSRAGKLLLNAYKNAPFLMELALSADEIGAALWESFREEFRKKRACISAEDASLETLIDDESSHILDKYYKL